jgi:hypothetical protein
MRVTMPFSTFSHHFRCHDKINHYTCDCDPGWDGVNCTQNIDECHPNPCMNGADCNDQVSTLHLSMNRLYFSI